MKTCVKDHGDSFSRLLQKDKNLISMYRGALVSGFVNMLAYLNTYIRGIILKTVDRFL